MYTDIRHDKIKESIGRNLKRAREPGDCTQTADLRTSARVRTSVCLPKGKCKQSECWYGRAYGLSDYFVEVTFDDIVQVNEFAEANSYMFVGDELRKYHLGVPMGDPLSCAAAQSVCLDAEMCCDARRQERTTTGRVGGADADRNLSLAVMDDLFFRVAYVPGATEAEEWSAESADAYIEELKGCYPDPLVLE